MKILISLIKSKNVTYINFLYNKYSEYLVNLGNYIIQKNYPFLHIERGDLLATAYDSCSNLWKLQEETIERHGIERILKMQMVQKVIILARRLTTQSHKILNTYIQITDETLERFTTIDFDSKIHELNFIIESNQKLINKLDNDSKLIFQEYYINNLSRKQIVKKYNYSNEFVNNKISNLKRLVSTKFIK